MGMRLSRGDATISGWASACSAEGVVGITHDAVSFQMIIDVDTQESTRLWIECCIPKHLWHHFSKAFEPSNLWIPASFVLREDLNTVFLVRRPKSFFAQVDPKQRRYSDEDSPVVDQGGHMSIEKGEQ